MTELLPCPFCGLEDGCVMGNKTDYVLCLVCGAQGPYVPAGKKAVKFATNDWNRRAQPSAGEVAKDAGWRDIESAPEGESVLVYMAIIDAVGIAHKADTGRWISNGGTIWPPSACTHWQPIPAPPVLPTKE